MDFLEGMNTGPQASETALQIGLSRNEMIPHELVQTLFIPKNTQYAWVQRNNRRMFLVNAEVYNPWTAVEGRRHRDAYVLMHDEDAILYSAALKKGINCMTVFGHLISHLVPKPGYSPKAALTAANGTLSHVIEVPRNGVLFASALHSGMKDWNEVAKIMQSAGQQLGIDQQRLSQRLLGPNVLNRFSGHVYVLDVSKPRMVKGKRLMTTAECAVFPASQDMTPVRIQMDIADNISVEELQKRDINSRAQAFFDSFQSNGKMRLFVSSGSLRVNEAAGDGVQFRILDMSHHFITGSQSIGGGIVDSGMANFGEVDFTAGVGQVSLGDGGDELLDIEEEVPFQSAASAGQP